MPAPATHRRTSNYSLRVWPLAGTDRNAAADALTEAVIREGQIVSDSYVSAEGYVSVSYRIGGDEDALRVADAAVTSAFPGQNLPCKLVTGLGIHKREVTR